MLFSSLPDVGGGDDLPPYRLSVRPYDGWQAEASKQLLMEDLPAVLILHLKRFVFDNYETRKVHKPVAYDESLTIPREIFAPIRRPVQPIEYELFGGRFGLWW